MVRKTSVDGFVPRRSTGMIGGALHDDRAPAEAPSTHGLQRHEAVTSSVPHDESRGHAGLSQTSQGISRADVDDSLREIDTQPTEGKKSPKRGGFGSRRRKIIRRIILLLIVLLLGAGVWMGVKALMASNAVFKGDIFGLIQEKQLKMDAKGRTNILILGTSEDDPGHQGANLTDSIMILSVDQKNKNAYMVSVPRDLEVKYGMACTSGYAGKINVYFSCVDDGDSAQAEDKRQAETRQFIGDIYGIEIPYSVHVNYSVMRDVVNAIGPITVNIQGSGGAPGVMDSNFDWKCKGGNAYASLATMKKNCPPNGHFIDYPNGPATLDAEHALYLAQARGDAEPTYGLGNSNFDREQNQQKIIVAIRDKALSSGTLTNPARVTGLIDAIGNNLRTNFETSEIRTLMNLAKDIPASSIQSINLLDDKIMTAGGQPVAGAYNYTQLRAYIQKKLYATDIAKEDAHVVVLNASGVAGAAQREADRLTELGFTVDLVGNASPEDFTQNTIYQLDPTNKQPLTSKKLAELYGTTIQSGAAPAVTPPATADFVIIVKSPTVSANSSATTN